MPEASAKPTAERFVEAMLDLIVEHRGSLEVNLRQISRRVGCAHTNAYNWFDGFEELRWAAFRRALDHYAQALIVGLDTPLTPHSYVERVVTNLAAYPQHHTGLYRFIGSDPIEVERVPPDVLATVVHMKTWLSEVFLAAWPGAADPADAASAADIVLAYIDGETLNIINGRVIPEENSAGRIVDNAMRLFGLLTPMGVPGDTSSRGMPEPTTILEPDRPSAG